VWEVFSYHQNLSSIGGGGGTEERIEERMEETMQERMEERTEDSIHRMDDYPESAEDPVEGIAQGIQSATHLSSSQVGLGLAHNLASVGMNNQKGTKSTEVPKWV
jgi:hypothetical protein